MTQPGSIPAQVLAGQDPFTQLARRLEGLERSHREIQSLLVRSGTIQSPNFDGVAATNTLGTLGWALDGPSGNAVFNNIALRGGVIGADALAHTIVDQRNSATFATAGADVLTQTITVPAGRTSALILVNGVANLQLPTSACSMSAYLKSSAGAIQSDASVTSIAASAFGNVGSTLASAPTGLTPGSTLTLSLHVAVSVTPPALSGYAAMTGLVLWL